MPKPNGSYVLLKLYHAVSSMTLPWLLAATVLLAALLGAFLGGRLAKEAQEESR